ncbi:Stf0 family sulfotransferase [uncultured Roseibium sp.]|uniref:Stf0 family sulfotransferase n=1 Tax=uncultured Roseibium sp. TaxID=1936171 RepID=UPI00263188BE|nr:Stf0 family sulfotransferase [uncultured Roseibium sp.]
MSYQAYVICTSPRSGSTLLCKLLAATGQAGDPQSYFHKASLDAWQAHFGLEDAVFPGERERLSTLFETARQRGSAGTGIFGLRLQRGSFDFFASQLKTIHPELKSLSARIEAVFGRPLFIHLTRGDKVAQAVSFVKASQTGLWHKAPDGTEIERLAPPQEPSYDRARIRQHVEEMTAYDQAWTDWFKDEDLTPLRIRYDELALQPVAAVETILRELGLDPKAAAGIELPVARLSDKTNREWIERFKAEETGSSSGP